jgi:uncharacterized metal-binding protein
MRVSIEGSTAMSCPECVTTACCTSEEGPFPRDCPTRVLDADALRGAYAASADGELARQAARVEAGGYCRLTRLEEIMDFARRCGFSRLGLAHCIGLQAEAAVVKRVFEANGLAVEAVACKAGALPKEMLGLDDDDKLSPGEFESMCNPIGQAQVLAAAETELNVLLGLCVGHDSLFFKHSVAPVTVLAAKDRVLGHNPLAAVYMADGYYHDRLFPTAGETGRAGEEREGEPADGDSVSAG